MYMYMYIIMYMCRDATEDKDSEHSEQSHSCGPPTKKACIFQTTWLKKFQWLRYDGDVMFCTICRSNKDAVDISSLGN